MAEFDWLAADACTPEATFRFLTAYADIPEETPITVTLLEDDEDDGFRVIAVEAGALRVGVIRENVPIVVEAAAALAKLRGRSPYPQLIAELHHAAAVADGEEPEA